MRRFKIHGILVALLFACAVAARAESSFSPSSRINLQRDSNYELNLKYLASADTAITPARVLRWISSLRGHSNFSQPSRFEFQPVLRAHDHQKEIIGQVAYKF